MANKYLVNTVRLGTSVIKAGSLLTDADDQAGIASVGGILWPTTDATVAAAALVAQAKIYQGASTQELDAIMAAAVSTSVNATAASADAAKTIHVQKVIGFADVQAAATTKKVDINATAFPTGAKLIAHTMKTTTVFEGGALSAVTMSVGLKTGGTGLEVIQGEDVFTGSSTAERAGSAGANPNLSIGGTIVSALFTGTDANLSALTQGSVTIDLYYQVIA
jgi:hypothetical protein